VRHTRTDVEQQVGGLLATARESLDLSLAFLSRMDGTTQHLQVVESSMPLLFKDGKSYDQATSLCQAIWDDKLPAVIPDLRKYPDAMKLPAARMPRLRSYVSVPVVLSDGTRYGTFCAAGFSSDKALSQRDQALLRVLAQAAATLLELKALVGAAGHLDRLGGYVAMNVSPATLLTDGVAGLLTRLPLSRVLLELSEHDQVEDYYLLHAALEPLRAAGTRLAIDDVGADFSSLRHIVLTRPDVIKLDRSIVTGLGADPVLSTLVHALVGFGRGFGAAVVAEGVETEQDATALAALGVDMGQGWYFGRPVDVDTLLAGELSVPVPRSPQPISAAPG